MRTWLLCCCFLLGTGAFVQDSTLLRIELEKLAVDAQSLQHDLPSFTCKESALSQSLKKRRVKKQMRFDADLRVLRSVDGRLTEQVDATEINGKPAGKRALHPPVMVEGGFDEALVYFLPEEQSCFRFTLHTRRLEFETPATTLERPGCRALGGAHGFATLDDAGHITHIERQVSPHMAHLAHLAIYTSIDLTPTELNGRFYPLSSHAVNDIPDGNKMLHFEAAYTSCRFFAATVTLHPAADTSPDR